MLVSLLKKRVKPGRIQFTWNEIWRICLAVLVLGFLFSFGDNYSSWGAVIFNFLRITVLIGFGFVFHELGHKVVAQMLGADAYFQLWDKGLILSIIVGLVTYGKLIFFAPGYVLIRAGKRFGFSRDLTLDDEAFISLAGPVTNLVIAFGIKILSPFLPVTVWSLIVSINAWLALFNLLPFPPLDGSKVFFWNRTIWLVVFLFALGALFLLPFINFVFALSITLAVVVMGLLLLVKYKLA